FWRGEWCSQQRNGHSKRRG
ncbi:hypothetical protein AZZ62_004985, partial [Klebsiella variicola]